MMLRNLIFFENHLDASTRQFLIHSLPELRKMGYHTLSVEGIGDAEQYKTIMKTFWLQRYQRQQQVVRDKKINIEHYLYHHDQPTFSFNEQHVVCQFVVPTHLFACDSLILSLIEQAESCGMRIIFTDHPVLRQITDKNLSGYLEPEEDLFSTGNATQHAFTSDEMTRVFLPLRDRTISKRLLSEVRERGNGIIHFSGHLHSALLDLLAEDSDFLMSVIVISDPQLQGFISKVMRMGMVNGEPLHLRGVMSTQLADPAIRDMFFNHRPVQYFDGEPSFSDFVEKCQLLLQLPLSQTLTACSETPLLGRELNRAMKATFSYATDEYHVLHATLKQSEEKTLTTIEHTVKNICPGLRFFRTSNELVIRGLNLPEHKNALQKFLHGVS